MTAALAATSPDVCLEFTDPGAVQVASAAGAWYLLGCESIPQEAIRTLGEGKLTGGEFCRKYRDAAAVGVTVVEGIAVGVEAWRAMYSTAELFFAIRRTGHVWISDHFKNVLAKLSPAERQTSDRGLLEHLLFRKPSPNATYAAAVTRLGHGEVLTVDLRSGKSETRLFDRIDVPTQQRPTAEYLDLMDSELAVAFERFSDPATTATMFSGGIDSALLQAYMGDRFDPVTFVPDSPEFADETRYARDAATVLGVSLNELETPEARFLEMIEATTDITGVTVFDDAKPYLAQAIREAPFQRLVTGHGADAAFGMSLKLARFASWFRWPGVLQTVNALSRRMPGHLGYRMGQVAPIAAGFALPVSDPFGYSGAARSHGETAILEQVFGPDLIELVNRESLSYVTDRLVRKADPASRFFSHIELAHWLMVFNNPVLIDNLVAHGCGKTVAAPYVAANVLEALSTIPVAERYVRGLRAKWILKDLLRRRVPGYPINQRKMATVLPWRRFYNTGPLQGIWDRYEFPEIFDGRHRDELTETPSIVTWTAMTYAVWQARIARNPNLQGHPTTVAAIYPIGPGRSSST